MSGAIIPFKASSGINIVLPPIMPNSTNSSTQSWILRFFQIVFIYGKIIFVIPFSITRANDGEISIRSGLLRKGIYLAIQIFLMAHINYRFQQIEDLTDDISVMKWIWKISFCLFITQDIVIYFFCGWRPKAWLGIVKQGIRVETQFKDLGINIRSLWDDIWVIGISVICFIMGLVHILALRNISLYDGTKLNDDDDIKLIPFTTLSLQSLDLKNEICKGILSVLIAIPDIIVWTIWHYGDAVRMTAAVAVGKLYQCLNDYLDQADPEEIKQNFNQIIRLHQSITELVNCFNTLLKMLTFIALIFNVGYTCYYANFILFGFGGTLRRICFVNFSIRSALVLWMTADINTKAHRITRTLGQLSADPSDAFPRSDPSIFAIFTSQVYHEHIGFKGLHFFTITTTFIGKTVGVLISYTVILIQFAKPVIPGLTSSDPSK